MNIRHRLHSSLAAISLSLLFSACSQEAAPTAIPPTAILTATRAPSTPTNLPDPTPTVKWLPTPSYSADPEAQHYLEGVESILRHSAHVLPAFTLGLGDVCPDRYLIAFVYVEPDARGGQTLHVDALPRDPDGTVHEGEHDIIWSIQREGLWWDRWNHIYMTDHSEPGSYQLQFLLEEPQGSGWQVGTAFGTCPGDDLRLTGLFPITNYLDFHLLYTRLSDDDPYLFWLQDGERLFAYRWEPWEETLIFSSETTPGSLVDATWTDDTPDVNGDGIPDLILAWDTADGRSYTAYAISDDHITPLGAVEPD